ncbi:unnamed protein product [marine sediment metagenome]|uniref:Uncharacterized protein n=1 Tax=marine sediment metagenome TaxID=412755 RepID=X1HZQ5_9ZZZZ
MEYTARQHREFDRQRERKQVKNGMIKAIILTDISFFGMGLIVGLMF